MIAKDELRRMAKIKRLSLENAEKDYVLDLLLFQIYGEFGNTLILKGGTSLYKLYNLNRFSEDLDFTLNKKRFNTDKFVSKVLKGLDLIGVNGRVKNIEQFSTETNIRLMIRGPLYDGSKESLCIITLNISHRERVQLVAKRELIVPVSREIPSFDVYVMDEIEILAEKVRAIMTRNKARDVYDIWFLLKRGVDPEISLIDRKLKIYKRKFLLSDFEKSIEEKRGFWDTDLRGLIIGSLPDFDETVREILRGFRDI